MDFFTDITGYVKAVLWGIPSPVASSPIHSHTFQQQDLIGPGMILRGFMAKGWAVTLLHHNTHLPHQTMAKLLQFIWDDVVARIWEARNDVLHRNSNHLDTLEFGSLGKRLHWFRLNRREALSFTDQFLINYDRSEIVGMSLEVRRTLVQHLEMAQQAYLLELSQIASRQNVSTRYFQRRVP